MLCYFFSDSLSALLSIESEIESSPIHQEIKYCFLQLAHQGVQITISWIPSHVGIKGNETVDKYAKEALSHDQVDYPNMLKDVSDLNRFLKQQMLNEWQSLWDANKKGRFYYQLQSKVTYEVKFSDTNRSKQTALTRLRFGKCLLGDILHLFKKKESNLCDTCNVKEDVHHFLFDCTKYRDFQVERNDVLLNFNTILTIQTLLGQTRWFGEVWNYVVKTERLL